MSEFYTVPEIREKLIAKNFKISERELRKKIRALGCAIEHRRQLLLTESDYQDLLKGMKTCSTSNQEARRRSTRSKVQSRGPATEYEKALERL